MDQDPPPTAVELGVSEAEYERILRDVRRRRGEEPPPALSAPRRPARRLLLA